MKLSLKLQIWFWVKKTNHRHTPLNSSNFLWNWDFSHNCNAYHSWRPSAAMSEEASRSGTDFSEQRNTINTQQTSVAPLLEIHSWLYLGPDLQNIIRHSYTTKLWRWQKLWQIIRLTRFTWLVYLWEGVYNCCSIKCSKWPSLCTQVEQKERRYRWAFAANSFKILQVSDGVGGSLQAWSNRAGVCRTRCKDWWGLLSRCSAKETFTVDHTLDIRRHVHLTAG